MIGLVIPVVLAAVFQVIAGQGPPHPPFPPNIPEQCRRPPQGVDKPHDCCKIPPFFAEKDLEECGFKKPDGDQPPPHHRGPPDCTRQICMLKKYNLLKEDGEVDHEALTAFVDKWSEENPDYKDAMDKAKERCIGRELPGPPQICEPNKIVFCVTSTIFTECPNWETTEGCQTLKAHIDECSPFFHKN